jgi:hypothetical protein
MALKVAMKRNRLVQYIGVLPSMRISLLLGAVLLSLFFVQCRRDNPLTGISAKLTFSLDTVLFDTIFTTVGSTTRYLKVYNEHSSPVKVDRLYIGGGQQSNYRVNVDGVPGHYHQDIIIPSRDSIFIFVEVTLDPNDANNPLIVVDSINFEMGSNRQDVKLAAWGQDAYFYAPQPGSGSPFYLIPECNAVWNNDKPHVVYGYAVVNSGCDLTINQGTRVYFHNRSGLIVLNDGRLEVNGSVSDKVVFRGDRLEMFYEDIPGQWDRIWLLGNSQSKITHAEIKNAIIGLQVDTIGNGAPYSLELKQTTIKNSAFIGLLAQGSTIRGENCLITNSGSNSTAFSLGGDYDIKHFTIANYWQGSSRQGRAFVLNNWYEDVNGSVQVRNLKAQFDNCIIDGNNQNEFGISFRPGGMIDAQFSHTLIKGIEEEGVDYDNVFWNETPGFIEPFDHIFVPSEGAFILGKGKQVNVMEDLLGNPRNITNPDLGAIELE